MILNRKITIKNDLREFERLTAFLEETASEWKFSNDLLFHLNLVVEEVVSNIILYGFEDNPGEYEILIELSLDREKLTISVSDEGIEFNPLLVSPPDDLDKPVNERKIGGLGVYFVRQIMDKVEYFRKNKSNVLVLTKKFSNNTKNGTNF